MAKAPVAGRVKTRLVPPFSLAEAAALAEAALADTLDAAIACDADEVIVALDGEPGPWLPAGCRIVVQRGGDLAERLTAAWHEVASPGLQIGMDTPQVGASDLNIALGVLADSDAVIGLAEDGGWWAIGLHRFAPEVFAGLVMSRPDTGSRQLARLGDLGLDVAMLATVRDVDLAPDVAAVAAMAPHGRFARCAAALERSVA